MQSVCCAGIILRIWSEGRWLPPPPPRALQGLAVLSAPVPSTLLHPVAALHVLTAIRRLAFLQHSRPLPPRSGSDPGAAGDAGGPAAPPEFPPAEEVTGGGPAAGAGQAANDALQGSECGPEGAAGEQGAAAAGGPQGTPTEVGVATRWGVRGPPPVDLVGRLDTLVEAAMKRESVSSRGMVQRAKARKLWLLTNELARLQYRPSAEHAERMAAAATRLARFMHRNGVHNVMDTLRAWHAHAPVPGVEAAFETLAARATKLEKRSGGARVGGTRQQSREAAQEQQRTSEIGHAPADPEAAALA